MRALSAAFAAKAAEWAALANPSGALPTPHAPRARGPGLLPGGAYGGFGGGFGFGGFGGCGQRLRVGYVSSDFGNHPLSHLMQSVFGMHDRAVRAACLLACRQFVLWLCCMCVPAS